MGLGVDEEEEGLHRLRQRVNPHARIVEPHQLGGVLLEAVVRHDVGRLVGQAQAAQDLGATPWTAFWTVTVPLSKAITAHGEEVTALVLRPPVTKDLIELGLPTLVIPSADGGETGIEIRQIGRAHV